MKIQRAIAFLTAIFAMLAFSPISASSSGFHKVAIRVLTAEGIPAEGQRFSTSYQQKFFVTDKNGLVEIELPSGAHTFTGKFLPPGSSLNATPAATSFTSGVSQSTSIEFSLPKVVTGGLLLVDPSGKPVSHAPLVLSPMGCPSTMELRSSGAASPTTIEVSSPRFIPRDLKGAATFGDGFGFVPNFGFGLGITGLGLRTVNGVATIDMFEVPLKSASLSSPSFNGASQNRCVDAGGDGIMDFGVRPASYQDWQLLDSSKLQAGTERVAVPEAPQFQVNLPMRVLDVRDYQVRITATGTLSAPHPSILERHGKVNAQILQGGGGIGRGTHSVTNSGGFSSELYINKTQTTAGASMALSTNLGFQSESLPTPPRFNMFWRGQDLSVSVSGVTSAMGPTQLTYGRVTRSLAQSAQGEDIEFTLRRVTPVSKGQFRNRFFDGTLQFTTAFVQCQHVWKVFDGGIARSSASKNKGQKSQKVPTVFPGAYEQSKRLDRDGDGIVCER